MRILMIIDGLPGGAAEKVLLTLAQGLVSQGHRVSIFSLRGVCDYALPEGIQYQIIADHAQTPWRKLTELGRLSRALDKTILASQQRNGEFDLVVSLCIKPIASWRAAGYCREIVSGFVCTPCSR